MNMSEEYAIMLLNRLAEYHHGKLMKFPYVCFQFKCIGVLSVCEICSVDLNFGLCESCREFLECYIASKLNKIAYSNAKHQPSEFKNFSKIQAGSTAELELKLASLGC